MNDKLLSVSLDNNISSKNISGKCDLKCSYSFTYSPTQLTSKNRKVLLTLTPDNSRAPPVTYNSHKYSVAHINIIHPSKHLYNGRKTPAELIIVHTPVLGGNPLHVCIPITQSQDVSASTSSEPVTHIIKESSITDSSDTSPIAISKLINLSDIVPSKPYFSYTNNTGDYILFAPVHGIPLQPKILKTLKSMISSNSQTAYTPNGVFFNKNGPNSSSDNSGIYISCSPTGHSDEEVNVSYSTSRASTHGSLSEWFETKTPSTIITYIAYFVLIVGCLFLLNFMFQKIM